MAKNKLSWLEEAKKAGGSRRVKLPDGPDGKKNYYSLEPYDFLGLPIWTMFHLKSAEIIDSYKVHISLERTEENLNNAYDILLPILQKYQVTAFKIVPLEAVGNALGSNADGKEVVIYMQRKRRHPENNPERWKEIFNEIGQEFEKKGIKKGRSPQGDQLINACGNGYISERATGTELFHVYKGADTLKNLGFTRGEAANLNGKNAEFWNNFAAFLAAELVSHKSTDFEPPTRKTATLQPHKRKIDGALKATIQKSYEHIVAQALQAHTNTSFYNFLCRDDVTKKVPDFNESPATEEIHKKVTRSLIVPQMAGSFPSIPGLQSAIEESAAILSIVHNALPNPLPEDRWQHMRLMPTLYRRYLVPLLREMEKDPNFGEAEIKKFLQEPGPQRDAFVKSLVKCSLRDAAVKQIDSDNPVYVQNLSVNVVEGLVEQAHKHYQQLAQDAEKNKAAEKAARQAKLEALRAQAEVERKAKEEAERKAKEEVERKAKEEAERKIQAAHLQPAALKNLQSHVQTALAASGIPVDKNTALLLQLMKDSAYKSRIPGTKKSFKFQNIVDEPLGGRTNRNLLKANFGTNAMLQFDQAVHGWNQDKETPIYGGIGAEIVVDEANMLRINTLFNNETLGGKAPAAASGKLAEGDVILGVRGKTGNEIVFNDDIELALGHIRGLVGTDVTLLVAGKGEITVTRDLINGERQCKHDFHRAAEISALPLLTAPPDANYHMHTPSTARGR